MRRIYPLSVAIATYVVAASTGCTSLRSSAVPEDAGAPFGDAEPTDGAEAPADAGASDGGTSAPATYDKARARLLAMRSPGPFVPATARSYCTDNYLIWNSPDATLHSWHGPTQAIIDYTFTHRFGPIPYASDALLVSEPLGGGGLGLFATGEPNHPLRQVDAAENYASYDSALLRLDQHVGGTYLHGTQLRLQDVGTGALTAVGSLLPTVLDPVAYRAGVVVLPVSSSIPSPLYVADVVHQTVKSVQFDGALSLRQAELSDAGLVVSYVRGGGANAIRLYKNNEDGAARYEIADDLNARPAYFTDNLRFEHQPTGLIAAYKQWLFFADIYGIWAYELQKGTFAPVQLYANKATGVATDLLCVQQASGILLYRAPSETGTQVWALKVADWEKGGQ